MRVFEEQAVELVFRIFPLALRGSMPGENNIFTGTLNAASRSATKPRSSSSPAVMPGLSVTTAPGSSPSE